MAYFQITGTADSATAASSGSSATAASSGSAGSTDPMPGPVAPAAPGSASDIGPPAAESLGDVRDDDGEEPQHKRKKRYGCEVNMHLGQELGCATRLHIAEVRP